MQMTHKTNDMALITGPIKTVVKTVVKTSALKTVAHHWP